MSTELVAPLCSITMTKRRRFFWAVWKSPPSRIPFKKPNASNGGASSFDEALLAAEKKIGTSVVVIDPLWARAWIRILRGEEAWPSKASREPHKPALSSSPATAEDASIWTLLGITRDATASELKAAYRKRAVELHPDQGGDEVTFRRLLHAYDEAKRRLKRPKPKPKPKPKKRTTT